MRWAKLQNGVLLSTAEADGFDAFVTVGRNLFFQ